MYVEVAQYTDALIIDTIKPTCNYLNASENQVIGIMATERTIDNKTYSKMLTKHKVLNFPCKNLAAIIEQNFYNKIYLK